MKIKFIYLVLALTVLYTRTGAQENRKYVSVKNYSKYELNIGQQTWQIDASDDNYTYFANNAGLVIHDGKNWEKLPAPNNTIVRTVKKHGDRIYIGTQGEFGYYQLKEQKYMYTSLSGKLENYRFNDIWHIEISHSGDVFFRSDESVFYYDGKNVLRLSAGTGHYNYLGKMGGKIILQDSEGYLFTFDRGTFQRTKGLLSTFSKGRIASIINYEKDTILFVTVYDGIFYMDKNGFYPWKTKHDELLKTGNIYCAVYEPGLGLGLGTSYHGVIVLDENREKTAHVDKSNGLQNNSVLSLDFTGNGGLWAGLDNGISYIRLNAYFDYINPDKDVEGTGYTAAKYKDNYYFGTNTGVYVLDGQRKGPATLLKGTNGQVWHLQVWKNHLIINHHNGLFVYDGSKLERISTKIGWWKILPLSETMAVAGNYEGLFYLHFRDKKFILNDTDSEFSESCRILYLDQNKNVWIAHPFRGLYILSPRQWQNQKTRVDTLSEKAPDGSNFYFTVFPGKQGMLLQSRTGFYYSNDGQSFKKDTLLEKFINPAEELKMLQEDTEGNIWYVTATETGFLAKKGVNAYKKNRLNEIHGRLTEGFQSVIEPGLEKRIFPLDKGFAFFSKKNFDNFHQKLHGFISKITFSLPEKDSILYFSARDSLIRLSVPHRFTNLFIYLSGNQGENSENVMYSYRIDNDPWSEWNRDHVLRLYTLSSGEHEISVRMMNETGDSKNIALMEVYITYPWYRSPLAIIFYLCTLGFLIYRYLRYIRENHRKEMLVIEAEKAFQEQKHLAEQEHAMNEIIRLQNEKLTNELNYKNQELASYTYHLVSKNELIQGIDSEISKLEKKYPDHKNLLKDLRNIHRLAEQNVNADADWEKFINNFDQVHAEFFKRLTETYDDLSPSDYKLCTYLRMNLTSKEIASIMNISLRSVETNRYRLRKKLNLDPETNLVQFLINF